MNSEQNISAEQPREQGQSGAAAMLRDAREAQGLSLADIAARTRIPLRQLEVIEAGAFASLPSRTYAIGFARTYARAIGLDEKQVTNAVRAELGDVSEPRSVVPGGMEPGDPAKLPSSALAWAGGLAALLLAMGLFAWFSSQFRAGEGAPPLVAEAEEVVEDSAAAAAAASDIAPASGGAVVFTALADDVWVRLFDQGGERFLEKTLTKGESFTVPAAARDPRLNTARPDALSVTIDGKPAAPLAAKAVVLASEPVSAAALLARGAAVVPPAGTSAAVVAGETAAPVRRRPTETRSAAPLPERTSPEAEQPVTAPPAPAATSPAPSAESEG